MAAPKYRTDSLACSCPGFWFRRTCKHYRAYREADLRGRMGKMKDKTPFSDRTFGAT